MSVLIPFGRFSYAIDVADSAAPAQRYATWAQSLGVPASSTLQPLDGDDVPYLVTLGASPYAGGSSTAMFCSEGGFAFYRVAPVNTTAASYALAEVGRMYGFSARAEALVTFHPDGDCHSTGVLMQRAGAVSIFRGRIKSLGQEANRVDFALRVDTSGWELVVAPIDAIQRVKLFLGQPQYDMYSKEVAAGAVNAFTFSPSTVDGAPFDIGLLTLPYIDSGGGVPALSGTALRQPVIGRKDYLAGLLGQGVGRVRGFTLDYVSPLSKPYPCRVRLVRERDGLQIREVWSGANGSYDFQFVDELQTYTVIAYYLDHAKRAVVTDGLTLANGKVELMP